MMKYVYALAVGAMMALGSLGMASAADDKTICDAAGKIHHSTMQAEMDAQKVPTIYLSGEGLELFAEATVSILGQKPAEVQGLLFPNPAEEPAASLGQSDPLPVTFFDANGCKLGDSLFSKGTVELGLGSDA